MRHADKQEQARRREGVCTFVVVYQQGNTTLWNEMLEFVKIVVYDVY